MRLPLHRLGREPVGLGLGNALRLVLDRLRPDLVRGRVRGRVRVRGRGRAPRS